MRKEAIFQRFNKKWKRDKVTGCWEWLASKRTGGYGSIKDGDKMRSAHRVSWELFYGDIPEASDYHGICVLHRCDNRGCVNPEHLFLGTVKDNNQDKWNKGREVIVRGEAAGAAKLTESEVLQVSDFRIKGYTLLEIADMYGVCKSTIWWISHEKTWKHLFA